MDTSHPRLLAALAFHEAPPSAAPAVQQLRAAVEDVVVPGLRVDLDWGTSLVTPHDDLERGGGSRWKSREWDRLIASATELESGSVGGYRRDVPDGILPPVLTANPVNATARLLPAGPGTMAWSVQEWAIRDWSSFHRSAVRWLLVAAEELGADSGFVTLDVVDAAIQMSAWEIVARVSPSDRDFAHRVWGYGWGTLLTAEHLRRVGGLEPLAAVPGAQLLEGPGGLVWVTLGADPRDVDPAQVAALRHVLAPVLTSGRQTVEQYFAPSTDPFVTPPRPYVV